MLAGQQHQAAEHDAAVRRLAEAQETSGVTPVQGDEVRSAASDLPDWDGPTFGAWNDGSQR
jgi:hypothetical protein